MCKLPIVETFEGIQTEGFYAFTPMYFIRLAGCNLKCPFCDTNVKTREVVTISELVQRVLRSGRERILITGGEPCIHEDLPLLVKALHRINRLVHLETNGTLQVPLGFDWVTVSPKSEVTLRYFIANEVKFLSSYPKLILPWLVTLPHNIKVFIQPTDPGGEEDYLTRIQSSLVDCKPYLEKDFKLSLQWHKHFNWR